LWASKQDRRLNSGDVAVVKVREAMLSLGECSMNLLLSPTAIVFQMKRSMWLWNYWQKSIFDSIGAAPSPINRGWKYINFKSKSKPVAEISSTQQLAICMHRKCNFGLCDGNLHIDKCQCKASDDGGAVCQSCKCTHSSDPADIGCTVMCSCISANCACRGAALVMMDDADDDGGIQCTVILEDRLDTSLSPNESNLLQQRNARQAKRKFPTSVTTKSKKSSASSSHLIGDESSTILQIVNHDASIRTRRDSRSKRDIDVVDEEAAQPQSTHQSKKKLK
jgi:hypothetical protein